MLYRPLKNSSPDLVPFTVFELPVLRSGGKVGQVGGEILTVPRSPAGQP